MWGIFLLECHEREGTYVQVCVCKLVCLWVVIFCEALIHFLSKKGDLKGLEALRFLLSPFLSYLSEMVPDFSDLLFCERHYNKGEDV